MKLYNTLTRKVEASEKKANIESSERNHPFNNITCYIFYLFLEDNQVTDIWC